MAVILDGGKLRLHVVVSGGDAIMMIQRNFSDGEWYKVQITFGQNQMIFQGWLIVLLPILGVS